MTPELISELFEYRSGGLYWRVKLHRGMVVGSRAGNLNPTHNYRTIRVFGKNYREHRLIFLWFHGWLPDIVDHINGDTTDNRVDNLRAASGSENQYNRKVNNNNSSGYKGISWESGLQKWRAQIRWNKQRKIIGRYNTIGEAVVALSKAREQLHGVFRRD